MYLDIYWMIIVYDLHLLIIDFSQQQQNMFS